MIFWTLWTLCSLIVFKHAITHFIKEEIDAFGEIESGLLFLYGLIALLYSLFGPLAILAYFLYNVLEDITQDINERSKK